MILKIDCLKAVIPTEHMKEVLSKKVTAALINSQVQNEAALINFQVQTKHKERIQHHITESNSRMSP